MCCPSLASVGRQAAGLFRTPFSLSLQASRRSGLQSPDMFDRSGRAERVPPRRGAWIFQRLLIEAGANVNQKLPDGQTPLSEAILFNRPDVVRVLLEHGANPECRR